MNEAIHCREDALFWIFSTGKPLMTVLVLILAERGLLGLDHPVAAYWPEFGRRGKSAITIRQVLQHRSGLLQRWSLGDLLAVPHWEWAVRRVEQSRPTLPVGEGPAYQVLSYGFILGELIQRATGRPLREVLQSEILGPLRMRDTFLGLPRDAWERHVPISGDGFLSRFAAWALNGRALRQAVFPSGGISTTARDMARFYQMLLSGGAAAEGRILKASSIQAALEPSSSGDLDRCVHLPIRWAQGFQLGGPRLDPRLVSPMGRASSPMTFGHNGSNCCIAWADPTRQLVFVYLSNLLTTRPGAVDHLAAVADDVLSECGAV